MKYTPKFLKLWTLPECYVGPSYPNTYSSGFGQSRDSDCLERSNFRCALKALQEVSDEVEVISETHWAVGWVEWIAINADDFKALEVADRLVEKMEAYLVLNEDDFSQLEDEEAQEVWANCYNDKERIDYVRKFRNQFEFHSFADMLGCLRGKYFAGYASELLG